MFANAVILTCFRGEKHVKTTVFGENGAKLAPFSPKTVVFTCFSPRKHVKITAFANIMINHNVIAIAK